jgi:hypothetical protein
LISDELLFEINALKALCAIILVASAKGLSARLGASEISAGIAG